MVKKIGFKVLIAQILTRLPVSTMIDFVFKRTVPSIKYPNLKINNSRRITNATKAQFFFGLYESGELRFIDKYLKPNQNVIELGSSIGVISSFVAVKKSPKKLVLVEANSDLIEEIRANLKLNCVEDYSLINKGIGQDASRPLWFTRGRNNTTGNVSEKWSESAEMVACIELHDLVRESSLDEFVLISDIEGAEVFLFNNAANFNACKMLIMELHNNSLDGKEVSVCFLKQQIVNMGFTIIDEYGSIVVASKG